MEKSAVGQLYRDRSLCPCAHRPRMVPLGFCASRGHRRSVLPVGRRTSAGRMLRISGRDSAPRLKCIRLNLRNECPSRCIPAGSISGATRIPCGMSLWSCPLLLILGVYGVHETSINGMRANWGGYSDSLQGSVFFGHCMIPCRTENTILRLIPKVDRCRAS